MKPISRRTLIKSSFKVPALVALCGSAIGQSARPRKMSDVGWCWDGQGFCLGVPPSIFGIGEGTRWFGLRKVCYMFHPNTALAIEKLRDFDEVVCEISKWRFRRCEKTEDDCGVANHLDGTVKSKSEEASLVSRLSQSFSNITGAIDDDLLGIIKREGIRPHQYASVYEMLKKQNPKLKLWTVVYTHELKKEDWAGFETLTDSINLWESDPRNLPNLPRYVDKCQAIFPGKTIILGCYLRDFQKLTGVPLDLLSLQWGQVLRFVMDGTIAGYSILGGFLIDMHPEQARWVRNFIAAN